VQAPFCDPWSKMVHFEIIELKIRCRITSRGILHTLDDYELSEKGMIDNFDWSNKYLA